MSDHPRDILHTLDVCEDIGTYEAAYSFMRLQFRRDGSVTWTPIPPETLRQGAWTYDTKTDTIVRGAKPRTFN